MSITRKERAELFTELMRRLYFFSGGEPGGRYSNGGDLDENPWMQLHPDLLAEFGAFMAAFRAEVKQRYEEE